MSLTVSAGTTQRDVVVELEPGTRVGALADELARALGFERAAGLWLDAALLEPGLDVQLTPLAEGAVVAVDGPRPPHPLRRGGTGFELRVVGGPDAGQVFPLRQAETVVGRSHEVCRVRDDRVTRRHAVVRLHATGVTVEDLGSTNGTALDGVPLSSEVALPEGVPLQIGESVLVLSRGTPPDTAVSREDDLTVSYNRPPRLVPPRPESRVTLPEPPKEGESRAFPVVMLVVPLLFAGVMAFAVSPRFLLFGLLSPVMLLSTWASDRSRGKTSAKKERQQYEADVAAAHDRLERLRREEERARREEHPDPAAVLLTALGPRRRLWERRRRDEDALDVRVGLADLPARVSLVHPRSASQDEPPAPPLVRTVPVVLPLREVGVLGLAGPVEQVRAQARWVVGQLAALHSPRDLTVVVLTDRSAQADWGWASWLPHLRPPDGPEVVALVGNDSAGVATRLGELAGLVQARQEALRAAGGRAAASSFPAFLVVLDGARALRRLPGAAQVLTDGPEVGVYAVCLDEEERLLPEECQAVVATLPEAPSRAVVRRAGAHAVEPVLVDAVGREWAGDLARALAPLRDTSAGEDDAGLPATARLLELLECDPPEASAVVRAWGARPRSATAVLGTGTNGEVALHLDSTFHGLVAGTTGSGKSELLQTLVASLALVNRPDEMNFLLVDYKGGSAFAECADLPHTVGLVTDLDPHLVVRALRSLDAEFDRRQRQLRDGAARAGVANIPNIDEYNRLRDAGAPLAPLPRLLLVIDEFAAMVTEFEGFVAQLVDLGARGRSVGMHLVLATQSPGGGVVSGKILANLQFRVALRVADAGESSAVLDDGRAATISRSTPGRGFLHLGPGLVLPFQSGRVGGRRPGRLTTTTVPPWVGPREWSDLGARPPARPKVQASRSEETDLADIARAVRAASEQLQVPAQRSPWLEALPAALQLDALLPDGPPEEAVGPLVYGLADLPSSQAQVPVSFDPAADGHLLAVGSAQSGRTQLLRTLAATVARRHSTQDVHLYALDCGGGGLLPLARLPHCGAVVLRGETERATRLLGRLGAEVQRRQQLLAAGGHASVAEQRASAPPGERLPHLLLLLDRWESFLTSLGTVDHGALHDAVLALLQEGASAGVHLVVTGDTSLAKGRVSTLSDNRLALRLSDRGDYAYLGLSPRAVPEAVPPGRAFRADSGTELQVALLAPDPAGRAQADALLALAAEAVERDGQVPRERRPFRVDVLPAQIALADALALRAGPTPPLWALVGVGGDELTALGPDLAAGAAPAFVVAGPSGSGRSTALLSLARSLLAVGTRVVVAAPRPSPLRDLAGEQGVLAVVTGPDLLPEDLQEAFAAAGSDPVVVVVDDGEHLRDCSARDLLRSLVRGVEGPPRAVVLGGSAEEVCAGLSGWQVDAKRAKRGLLLSPQGTLEGDLVGLKLTRAAVGGPVVPGRGLLNTGDGRPVTVQVPQG